MKAVGRGPEKIQGKERKRVNAVFYRTRTPRSEITEGRKSSVLKQEMK